MPTPQVKSSSSLLRGIAYVSAATKLMGTEELEALLVDARTFNRKASVTGVLLYHDGSFLQYLEGPEPTVTAVYQRIKRSSQHGGITELINDEIERRSFPDWQMGLSQTSASELLSMSTASWIRSAADTPDEEPISDGMMLLRQFWMRAVRGPL